MKSFKERQYIEHLKEEHSKKPAEIRNRIVGMLGDVLRIELFARQKVDGWDCWGNAEGNLCIRKDGTYIITPDETILGKYGEVNKETVGQYTGLHDKNGKEIYEGDIVLIDKENNIKGIVKYSEVWAEFIVVNTNSIADECEPLGDYKENIEVLGNEFDNLDLDVCKEKGKMYEFECPTCKEKANAIKNTYNGHLWAKCDSCDMSVIQ